MTSSAPLLLAISGPSSSGKTTLARLLRSILPPDSCFILHEDDFYLTDTEIPIDPVSGLQDWDCLGSLDLPFLTRSLTHIKTTGATPPELVSQEDQNEVGDSGVSEMVVDRWRERVTDILKKTKRQPRRVAIVDGFLLFAEAMPQVREQFDVKMFLRTDFAAAKQRRENRSGYVTLEGFWTDPPGYVEKIVWPNYVKDHAFLFKEGNVEGEIDTAIAQKLGIDAAPAGVPMEACLDWAMNVLLRELEKG